MEDIVLGILLKKSITTSEYTYSSVFSHKEFKKLLNALAQKDYCTYVHSLYVVHYATIISKALNLSDLIIEDIILGGWLHDIGKLFIPNSILQKKCKLTHEEYEFIKIHVECGVRILSEYDFHDSVKTIVKLHHEKYDGSGYPYGISGKDTPLEAKIIQVADACSAMTICRAYRASMPLHAILHEIERNSGTQFDPNIVDTLKMSLNHKSI
jgi:putative nucleotidyltransferase with HDIG domain